MYAMDITLSYKNQKKFYTNYGAMASLLVYIAVFSLIINSLISMSSLNASQITVS